MRKRFYLSAVVLLLLTASISWAEGQNEASDNGMEKKRIVHYHWTETVYDQINNHAVDMFQETHPNVEVKLLLFADADRATKIRTALASGGEIDSFALSNGEAAEFYENDQMIEIIPAAFGKDSIEEVVDMWEPGSIKSAGGIWKGKYYGIPFELSNYAAWINTKFMTEAGLDPVADIPKTWPEFVDVAQKMTVDEGGVRVRNGFATNPKASIFPFLVLSAFVAQQGLDWSSEEGMIKSLDSPKLVDAFRIFTNFATEDDIWDPGLFDNDREGFGNGLTATFLTGGTWYWGVLDQYSVPREDVTPFAYPRTPGGEDFGGIGYGYCVYVSKLAKDPELTWEWLDTLASQPNAFIKQGLNQPRKTQDPKLAAEYIPNYDVFGAELKKTSPWITSTHNPEIQDAVWAACSRVIFEGMDVNESVKVLKSDITSILE